MAIGPSSICSFLSVVYVLNQVTSINAVNIFYHSTTDLGSPNDEAASGNPLKGFLTSPDWSNPPYGDDLPSSLEFYYI
eukprot:1872489-Ditylum_brightwellii.AAC.1